MNNIVYLSSPLCIRNSRDQNEEKRDEFKRNMNYYLITLLLFQDMQMQRFTSAKIQSVLDRDVIYPVDLVKMIPSLVYAQFVLEDFSWFVMSPSLIVLDTIFLWQLCSTERLLWMPPYF